MVTDTLHRWLAVAFLLLLSLVQATTTAHAAPEVADGDTRLVVEIEAGSETLFVGEMILVTITGYYDVTITLERFEGIELPNFTWLQLGRDIWSRDRVDGREFKTFERKLALYPQKNGVQTIGPFTHDLTLMDTKGERFKHEVTSNSIALDIQPKPQTNGGWWFPARDVILSDTWDMDPASMANDATATRTIRITARGQPAENLPNPPLMSAPWLVSFIAPERRSTEITRQGPVGTVEWTWRLRPSNAEPGEIRAFRIPWFDTDSRDMREVVIPSQRVAFAAIEEAEEEEETGVPYLAPALPLLLGLLIPIAAVLPGRRFLPARTIGARLTRWMPTKDMIALRYALWRGDRRSYRKHAARLIEKNGMSPETLIADLDRGLYGAQGNAEAVDLRALHRQIGSAGGYGRT